MYNDKIKLNDEIKNIKWGQEIARNLRELVAHPKEWGLIPSTHVVIQYCNSSSREFDILLWPL